MCNFPIYRMYFQKKNRYKIQQIKFVIIISDSKALFAGGPPEDVLTNKLY